MEGPGKKESGRVLRVYTIYVRVLIYLTASMYRIIHIFPTLIILIFESYSHAAPLTRQTMDLEFTNEDIHPEYPIPVVNITFPSSLKLEARSLQLIPRPH